MEDISQEDSQGRPAAEKVKTLLVIGKKTETVRTTLTNWMLIIGTIFVFLCNMVVQSPAGGEKDWVFWLGIVTICLLGMSIISGVSSHFCYFGGLLFESKKEILWDNLSVRSLWSQMVTLNLGVLLTVVCIVSRWVTYNPTGF